MDVKNDILLFPNPASTQLTVAYNIKQYRGNANLVFISSKGITLHKVNIHQRKGKFLLNLNTYPPGTFFCKLLVEDKVIAVSSFVVQK